MKKSSVGFTMNIRKQYLTLLYLLGKVSEGQTRLVDQNNSRLEDAEGLVVKFYFHSISVFYLWQGSIINCPPLPRIDCVDVSSITAVARAALEAFLTFHHVFVAPTSEEVRDFRYWAWLLSGLCERQRFPATEPKHQEQKGNEKRMIEELHSKLVRNSQFTKLSRSQKKNVKKGRWRLSGWKELARDTGLNELHASTIYGYLSGYAHSDSLSVLQVYHAQPRARQEKLATIPVKTTMIATANMVFLYCDVFPGGKTVLDQNSKETKIAQFWRALARVSTDAKG